MKALYRRAQAYIEAADLDLAKLDIQKALELDPKNKLVGTRIIQLQEIGNLSTSFFALTCREVKSLQMTLKQLQAEKNRRDAKLYANMFQWTRKDADVMVKVSSKRSCFRYCKRFSQCHSLSVLFSFI